MESAGTTPRVAVTAPELTELLAATGPVLTVYLTTDPEIENAAMLSEQRWKTLRASLAADGAPEDVLAAVDPLVADAHHDGACLVVVANADGVLHVEHQPEPPKQDVGFWAPLPHIGPLIEWRQSSPAHVVVLADRTGADLIAFRSDKPDITRAAGGEDGPVTKVNAGGWSQRRYQERAENTWEQNAEDVAKELTRLVERVDARLVVAAGDVRALQLLRESLPQQLLDIFEVVDGSRTPDGSTDEISDEVVRLVATAVSSDTVALLDKFKEEKGQHDRAADGPAAVVAALNQAQVDVLLLHADPDDERTLWFGPDPIPVADNAQDLRDLGVEDPQEGRLVDALVRAAFGTGAGVRIVPKAVVKDGAGAVLRWSQ